MILRKLFVVVGRVCPEKELELIEFNFKVQHRIMPCGVVLKKCTLRTQVCMVFVDNDQTIVHLHNE